MLLFHSAAFSAVPGAMSRCHVYGVVTDSLTNEPVEFASVLLTGTTTGKLADANGRYDITTSLPFDTVEVSAMGYKTRRIAVKRMPELKLDIKLTSTGLQLGEVVARRKKEHYSKKNNPAVDMMHRIRDRRDLNDPRRNDWYNYDKYERITLAYNDYHPSEEDRGKFSFLKEYIDTSEVTGKTILNLAIREKVSTVNYRHDPESEKEVIRGLRNAGIDEMIEKESMQRFYEDVMREIDVYQNDVTLLQNRFVSPLSRIAPDFYKFYLTDTVMIDSLRCAELTFTPRNPATMGFTGRFYVDLADSTMFIKRIMLHVPIDINLNFIDAVYVSQDYERAADGSRLKTKDDMVVEARVMPGSPSLYTRRITTYSDHNFDRPTDESVFSFGGEALTQADAYTRDDKFWADSRTSSISHSENSVQNMMARLRSVPLFYWAEKVVKILVTGYIPTGNPSKFDVGPMNTTISFNDVEGLRLRAGGMTTGNLSRRWFARGYGAYGFKDHKWKYKGELEYSFHDKNYHSREFPVHSLRLTHMYDVDMLGQHYLFTNADNMFLSLKRMDDTRMTYQRLTKLEYTLELHNNFSVLATLKNERQEATRYMPFTDGFGQSFGHYTINSFTLQLRYAPGEKFFQTKSARIPINLDAPVFTLSHTVAPGSVTGNPFTINRTEASVQKRFWFSAFGYADVLVKGGHVWSRAPYPQLLIPNANISYTIQPESFACLNPMEFITDTYAQWDLTYWANGAILNYIPVLKKLRLREAFSFRGFFGRLSDRNNPAMNPELYAFPADAHTRTIRPRHPYMEAAVGLDNLFKILRVDYVWRLTYRDDPEACLGGVRIALHFTF
ncbi:MAG: DUF5686 and carboxypeptidase regulatory-like domain-containing protein [Lachnoclostridium sp.]|nr:DUF5686 and carboxypeptidase regulatory-like domain-containing protein [Lachnoclostridium sp.]